MFVVQESTSQTVMAEKPEEVSNGDRAGLSLLWAWGYLIIRGIFFILFFEEKSNHN